MLRNLSIKDQEVQRACNGFYRLTHAVHPRHCKEPQALPFFSDLGPSIFLEKNDEFFGHGSLICSWSGITKASKQL